MDSRDVVVSLTELTPETKKDALATLLEASPEELEDFASFVARLLSIDTGRTVGVWAVGALVALWREEVEIKIARGASASELAWPVISIIRERCLPILFELRTTWFGWNEWDDCLIIAPLAAVRHDKWFNAATNVLFTMTTRNNPAAEEAQRMLRSWFAEGPARPTATAETAR
jgi:hypothetical protein